MGQLSATFFIGVVPRLSWVSFSNDEGWFLSMYVLYNAESLNLGKARACLEGNAECLPGPISWFDSSPRGAVAAPLVMKWELTKEELAVALSTGGVYADRNYFFNGFSLKISLMKHLVTSGLWHFGHVVNVRRAGCEELLPLNCVYSSKVTMRVSQRSAVGGWSSTCERDMCMGIDFPFMVPDGDLLNLRKVMALVEPYLVNGKLCFECSGTSCD